MMQYKTIIYTLSRTNMMLLFGLHHGQLYQICIDFIKYV